MLFSRHYVNHFLHYVLNMYPNDVYRYYEQNNLEGAVGVFMDSLVAQMFDLVVWDYCSDYWILPQAIPRFISSGLSALHLGIMPRYITTMLCYIHSR